MIRLLTIAAAAGAAIFASAPRWPVVLPITLERTSRSCRSRSTETLTFILDSAAAGCVIDGESAAELGLKEAGTGLSSGSGGTQAVGLLSDVRLNLGGLEIRLPSAYTFDMKALRFHGHVDGILGMPLFGRYVVEIDYPGSQVRNLRAESYRASPKATVFPLRMTVGPVIRRNIRVRGKEPIFTDMLLDTGSAHTLALCTPFVDRHHPLEIIADNPLVRFARQTSGAFGSERHFSANLGGEFFKRHKVTFDIPNLRVLVE
jgi:hypothetical protein